MLHLKPGKSSGWYRIAGRGDLVGLVLGSTAHKVIQLADGPILVVWGCPALTDRSVKAGQAHGLQSRASAGDDCAGCPRN
jgi:hypothetical protein